MISYKYLPAWMKAQMEADGFTDVRRSLRTTGRKAGVTVITGMFPRGAGREGSKLRAELRRDARGRWVFLRAEAAEHGGRGRVTGEWSELRDFVSEVLLW